MVAKITKEQRVITLLLDQTTEAYQKP